MSASTSARVRGVVWESGKSVAVASAVVSQSNAARVTDFGAPSVPRHERHPSGKYLPSALPSSPPLFCRRTHNKKQW